MTAPTGQPAFVLTDILGTATGEKWWKEICNYNYQQIIGTDENDSNCKKNCYEIFDHSSWPICHPYSLPSYLLAYSGLQFFGKFFTTLCFFFGLKNWIQLPTSFDAYSTTTNCTTRLLIFPVVLPRNLASAGTLDRLTGILTKTPADTLPYSFKSKLWHRVKLMRRTFSWWIPEDIQRNKQKYDRFVQRKLLFIIDPKTFLKRSTIVTIPDI